MIFQRFFRSVFAFILASKEKEKEKQKLNSLRFFKSLLKKNNIDFVAIQAIYTVAAADYSEEFFNTIKNSILNKKYSKAKFEGVLNYNRSHLHFKLVILDNEEKYIFAIKYPFDYLEEPRVLWLYKLSITDDSFVTDELTKHKLY